MFLYGHCARRTRSTLLPLLLDIRARGCRPYVRQCKGSNTHGTCNADRAAGYKPVVQLLQDILPPIAHAVIFVADALVMRDPATPPRPSSNPELSRRPSILEVSLSQRGARQPTITLQQLMQPRGALDSHSAALLAQVTAGSIREPLRRLVRSAGAKSYVPLVPIFAVIAGWRKHLSQFPATAPLNAELKEVGLSLLLSPRPPLPCLIAYLCEIPCEIPGEREQGPLLHAPPCPHCARAPVWYS